MVKYRNISRIFKRTAVILLTAVLLSALSGCSQEDVEHNLEDVGGYIQQARKQYVDNNENTEQSTETVTEVEQEPQQLPEIYYAYHTLDRDGQRLYLEILHALQQMETDADVSTLDTEQLNRVFQYVLADHPELFYVEGYQYTQYMTAGVLTGLTFSGTYTMSPEDMQQTMQSIENRAQEMMAALDGVTDQYTIVRYLYDSLIISTEYDSNALNNQNIQSVFLEGHSVCQGYAKAMQYLLQKQGVQAVLVTGYTNGEGHAWDMVLVDGDYYYLDPTWGDASYTRSEETQQSDVRIPSINYDYFLVTTQELAKTHQLDDLLSLPECTATADNYYVHEGLYLDGYDEDRIKQIFESSLLNQTGYITMKCSDEAVYSQVRTRLIDDQEVFRFLQGEGSSISYTMNETQLTISFWI